MLTYSIAIRTLGTGGEKYLEELRSITQQTILPERVVVYIAKGYDRPKEQIGNEEYVWVHKGMIAQRALRYDEITSDCILLLDDDVLLAPDSAERLLRAMEENKADCVGADTFRNQDMSFRGKVFAAVTNLVFPRRDDGWAFKIHRTGSFSYNNHPQPKFYLSESCAGPCMLWQKSALILMRWEDEVWVEQFGFAYGDDLLETYKLVVNGGRLGVLYDSGVLHLDAQSASSQHRNNLQRYYVRSMVSAIIWHRTIWQIRKGWLTAFAFAFKQLWLLLINSIAGLVLQKPRILVLFLHGLRDANRYCKSDAYQSLPPFVIDDIRR